MLEQAFGQVGFGHRMRHVFVLNRFGENQTGGQGVGRLERVGKAKQALFVVLNAQLAGEPKFGNILRVDLSGVHFLPEIVCAAHKITAVLERDQQLLGGPDQAGKRAALFEAEGEQKLIGGEVV